ncbi:MAG: tRNA (adenosine(37)-N6)-threonylcarbamoyltransferase complex transferase subunit TsaD [Patescibacteria group bacterium]
MKILAIETSCDETAAAVVTIAGKKPHLNSSVVYSQIREHQKTGGIVPEVASRVHVSHIARVVGSALKNAKVTLNKIDYIAVTSAPGLTGSLLVGTSAAKTFAMTTGLPIIPVNHLEGHMYSNFINEENKKNTFLFPAVVLLVSGGHTSLVLMKDHGKYKTLGYTVDDAVGEAFDKVAKILDLGYPGGPAVSKLAQGFVGKERYKLPRPMIDTGDFKFSFSGIKTAVLYAWQKEKSKTIKNKQAMAYAFEQAVVDVLVSKTMMAAKKYKAETVSICGGVAANKRLREQLGEEIKNQLSTVSYVIPQIQFCGDNAAMIAMAAAYRLMNGKKVLKKTDLSFPVLSNKDL